MKIKIACLYRVSFRGVDFQKQNLLNQPIVNLLDYLDLGEGAHSKFRT